MNATRMWEWKGSILWMAANVNAWFEIRRPQLSFGTSAQQAAHLLDKLVDALTDKSAWVLTWWGRPACEEDASLWAAGGHNTLEKLKQLYFTIRPRRNVMKSCVWFIKMVGVGPTVGNVPASCKTLEAHTSTYRTPNIWRELTQSWCYPPPRTKRQFKQARHNLANFYHRSRHTPPRFRSMNEVGYKKLSALIPLVKEFVPPSSSPNLQVPHTA